MIDFEFEFQYAEAKLPILRQVGGGIPAGRCVVLCGGSGCGKSTLLRCINGLIPQFYEGELRGFCRLNGQDTAGLRIGEIGELAASVFQDPRSQFFTVNSSNEVAFGLENHGLPQDKIRRRVDEAFRIFHLERLKDRNVYELSSGERQLISILSAWAMDTDIFLLDEPTANLDFAATQQLKEILLALKKQGKTLLLSEHRLYYLADRPGFSFPASKSDLYNLHLHHSVTDFGKKTEKAADGWVFQIGVAQHIASARDLQTAVPRADLTLCVGDCEVRAHVLDFRALEPCLGNHLYRRPVRCVKYQHAAGESVCHSLHQCFDLFRQKVVEHAGGKEHRVAGGIDLGEPFDIVQIAGDVFLPLSGGQQLIAHGYDIGKVQIVDFAATVITAFSGAVQPAAQIDHRRVGVRFQIIPHLKSKVILPHGHLQ